MKSSWQKRTQRWQERWWLGMRPWLAGALSVGFLMLVVPAGVSANKDKVPDVIDINTQAICPGIKGLPKDTKKMEGFSHKLHAEKYLKGNEKYSPIEYTDDFTCKACHISAKSKEELLGKNACEMLSEELLKKDGTIEKPMKFFHTTCQKCHKNMKKAGVKTGPASCKGCHGKKK